MTDLRVIASDDLTRRTPMAWTTCAAIYFIIWWVVLFAALPFGVRSQQESGEVVVGSDPGAPTMPRLGPKLIWTTGISAVIFGLFWVVYTYRLISFDSLATLGGLLKY